MRPTKLAPSKDTSKFPFGAIATLLVVAVIAFFAYRKLNAPEPLELDTARGGGGNVPVPSAFYPSATVDTKPFESLGSFAADEAMALIGNSGTVAIITESPDPKAGANHPMARTIKLIALESETFKKHLNLMGKFTLVPELKLMRPEGAIKTVWPPGEFAKLLQKHPPHTTIVAFCDLPSPLSGAEKQMIRQRTGKVIVIGGVVPEVDPTVQEGLIHLAIATKAPVPPKTGDGPETPSQWVRRVFAVLKPGTAKQP